MYGSRCIRRPFIQACKRQLLGENECIPKRQMADQNQSLYQHSLKNKYPVRLTYKGYPSVRVAYRHMSEWGADAKELNSKPDSGKSLIAELIAKEEMDTERPQPDEVNIDESPEEMLLQKYEEINKYIKSSYEEDQEADQELTDTDESDTESDYFLEDIVFNDQQGTVHRKRVKGVRSIYGSADPAVPFSDVPCSGCGAKLHCQNTAIPGYMPKEKFTKLTEKQLKQTICQKCFLMTYRNFCLNVRSSPDEYRQVISELKKQRGLIILVVDMTDITNSVIKDLPKLVGNRREYFVIGNKIDLLPADSKNYLHYCKTVLHDWCVKSGLAGHGSQIKHLCLVSAKTGYGIEELVSKLIKEHDRSKKEDVFLLGSTNAGKSTLFNALLSSDYCKYHFRDVVHRATVSRWPGTTIDLLKFPIIAPTGTRLYLRAQRLTKERKEKAERQKLQKSLNKHHKPVKVDTLTGHIGQTDFRPDHIKEKDSDDGEVRFSDLIVPPSYTFDTEGQFSVGARTKADLYRETNADRRIREAIEDSMEQLTKSQWLFDTPGLVNPEQVINLLTPEELGMVLPAVRIIPRSFVLKPGQVMFVSGLGRIDYFRGDKSIYFTVMTAGKLPVRVVDPATQDPDKFYEEKLGTKYLGVPLGDADRMMKLPALVGQEFNIVGSGWKHSAADIVLSSIGFVSVTAGEDMCVSIRAFTPGGRGCRLQIPALLPKAVCQRGERVKMTPKYRVRKNKPSV